MNNSIPKKEATIKAGRSQASKSGSNRWSKNEQKRLIRQTSSVESNQKSTSARAHDDIKEPRVVTKRRRRRTHEAGKNATSSGRYRHEKPEKDRGETREEEAKQETTPQDRGKRQAHQTNTEVRTLALPSILPLVN